MTGLIIFTIALIAIGSGKLTTTPALAKVERSNSLFR